ncbi:MAG: hypothetical protein GY757_15535, partial [bacterium]|nr:hypothetical protein [bacterium]
KIMFEDLISLGLSPNKSRIIEFPKNIPDKCISHFIRGCWDGDGSITIVKSGKSNKAIYAGIVSGSKDFIYQLRDILEKLGVVEGKINKHNKVEAYHLRYFGWRGERLCEFIYKDATPDMLLSRKYAKYQEYLAYKETGQLPLF